MYLLDRVSIIHARSCMNKQFSLCNNTCWRLVDCHCSFTQLQEAHIGKNVSLYLTPTAHTLPIQANRLATTILHDLKQLEDDQCLLLYGSQALYKATIFQSVLASLLSQTTSKLTARFMTAVQLLSLLTSRGGVPECVLTTSLYIDPLTMTTTGGHFSCMLLNTTALCDFEVC